MSRLRRVGGNRPSGMFSLSRGSVPVVVLAISCTFLRSMAVQAETVALWHFDEQEGIDPGGVLHDAGPSGYSLVLGRGAEIAAGKFGNALRPIMPAPGITTPAADHGRDIKVGSVRSGSPALQNPGLSRSASIRENGSFAARLSNADVHLRRAQFPNLTDSKLNIGERDWTIECWLKLDDHAQEEGTLFEIGAGPGGANELVTRISVIPRENAFVLIGLSADPDAGAPGRRVEIPNPQGPPSGTAYLRSATLALSGASLPRERWFHFALTHAAAAEELKLWIDGKAAAVAKLALMGLPHGEGAYVSIGRDGQCERALPGLLDEMRISDAAVYRQDFNPPKRFSRLHGGARLRQVRPLGLPFEPETQRAAFVAIGLRDQRGEIDSEVGWRLSGMNEFDPLVHDAQPAERALGLRGTRLYPLRF